MPRAKPRRIGRDFPELIKQRLRERVAFMCSHPLCRRLTVKRSSEGDGIVRQGKAAHIHAAGLGGPRADPGQSEEMCRSFENGVWLCDICAREVDDNRVKYPAELLRQWKAEAEK